MLPVSSVRSIQPIGSLRYHPLTRELSYLGPGSETRLDVTLAFPVSKQRRRCPVYSCSCLAQYCPAALTSSGRPLFASGSSSLSCALDGCKADLRLSRTASRGMFNGRRRVGQSRYREQIQEAIVIESAAYALPAGYRRACLRKRQSHVPGHARELDHPPPQSRTVGPVLISIA